MVSPSLTLLRTQSDERLTALARAGHERAFEAIVERYHRPLLRHGRRLLPEARAEDAVQQALVAAWAALRRGDEVRHLSGWLHRIVHNAALNALRGDRDDYTELREWVEATGAPEDQLERHELLRETLANLAALPERQREALLRVAVDGASAEDVGSSLGLTEGAVRQLLYRARTALRAAATSLTPMPVASWLARAEPLTAQVADATAGAGSVGVGALLAKTGVVAVIAGAAAAGPAVLGDKPHRARPSAQPISLQSAAAPRSALSDDRGRGSSSRGSGGADDSGGRGSGGADESSGHGSGGADDSSGHGSGGADDSSGHGSSGTSGSGSSESSGSGSSTSGSGPSGSSGTGSSGSSGSGSSGPSGSGPSASSGSGSSGTSGSASSGTSGSGSSGSGSSGSGSSGTGSSGTSGSGPSATSGSGSSVEPDPIDPH